MTDTADALARILRRLRHLHVRRNVKGLVLLENERTGRWYRVDITRCDATEVELEDVLEGRKEPHSISHLTRIVGYYSTTTNWNRSKLGELADRQRAEDSYQPSQAMADERRPCHENG